MVLAERFMLRLSSFIGRFRFSFVSKIGRFEVRILLVKIESVC